MAGELERIRAIGAQITVIDGELEQISSEISMLRHIDDDAQRDAVVTGSYEDRASAKMTRGDVARMMRYVNSLERERSRLIRKRDRLIKRLASR